MDNKQKLFEYMLNTHGLILTESEMIEIINIVKEIIIHTPILLPIIKQRELTHES